MHTAFDVLVVVSASAQTQVGRLMRERAMSEAAIRARIDAQLPLEAKAEVADVIVDNEGSRDDLRPQVERLWADLRQRAAAPTV
jgi:dephospho-CoA kinase